MEVVIEYSSKLGLLVVIGHGPRLLGRNWLENIKPTKHCSRDAKTKLDEVLKRHEEVFSEQLGAMKRVKVKISVDQNTHPQFLHPHTVPLVWKAKVEKELDRLLSMGIIEPVKFSD